MATTTATIQEAPPAHKDFTKTNHQAIETTQTRKRLLTFPVYPFLLIENYTKFLTRLCSSSLPSKHFEIRFYSRNSDQYAPRSEISNGHVKPFGLTVFGCDKCHADSFYLFLAPLPCVFARSILPSLTFFLLNDLLLPPRELSHVVDRGNEPLSDT